MESHLTAAAIEFIANGERVDAPVLKIVLISSSKTDEKEERISLRYLLSDGEDFISGILSLHCTISPPSQQALRVNSVVRLIDYTTLKYRNKMKLLISNLEVVSEVAEAEVDNHQEESSSERPELDALGQDTSTPASTLAYVDKAILVQFSTADAYSLMVCSEMNTLLKSVQLSLLQLNTIELKWQDLESKAKSISDQAPSIIKLDLRGKIFKVKKDLLLSVRYSYFHVLLSTDVFQPNQQGSYFLDIDPYGFEKILMFLEKDLTNLENLNEYEGQIVETLKQRFCLYELQEEMTVFDHIKDTKDSPPLHEDTPGSELISSSFSVVGYANDCIATIEQRIAVLVQRRSRWGQLLEQLENDSISATTVICLDLKGKVFKTCRETLMKSKGNYFHAMASSDLWRPDQDGSYFIDRWYHGFERLLEYMFSGQLSFAGLSLLQINCIKENMDYFQLKPPSIYTGHSDNICSIIQLRDGRICSGSIDGMIKIWDQLTNECEVTLAGHGQGELWLIELRDGRLCSCSHDNTIKLWVPSSQTTCVLSVCLNLKASFVFQVCDDRICVAVAPLLDANHVYFYFCSLVLHQTFATTKVITCLTCLGEPNCVQTVVGTDSKTLTVYNNAGGVTHQLIGHTGAIKFLKQINQTSFCSAAEGDSVLRIWTIPTMQLERSVQCDGIPSVYAANFFCDTLFYYCIADNIVKSIKVSTAEVEATSSSCVHAVHVFSPVKIIFPLASGSICTDYQNKAVRVWDVKPNV